MPSVENPLVIEEARRTRSHGASLTRITCNGASGCQSADLSRAISVTKTDARVVWHHLTISARFLVPRVMATMCGRIFFNGAWSKKLFMAITIGR